MQVMRRAASHCETPVPAVRSQFRIPEFIFSTGQREKIGMAHLPFFLTSYGPRSTLNSKFFNFEKYFF